MNKLKITYKPNNSVNPDIGGYQLDVSVEGLLKRGTLYIQNDTPAVDIIKQVSELIDLVYKKVYEKYK